MRRFLALFVLAGVVTWTGCSDDGSPVAPDANGPDLELRADAQMDPGSLAGNTSEATTPPELERRIQAGLTDFVRDLEARIAERRAAVGVETESVATAPLGYFWTGRLEDETVGGEVFFSDRGNKQLDPQWVPGDPRRNGRTDIGYAVFPLQGPLSAPGVTAEEVEDATDRAMVTWEEQTCSERLSIPRGSISDWLAFDSDILHAGFATLPPGVIGVTAPFVFVDGVTGEPTDIDSDGHPDYAFAVIVYSDQFQWAIDGNIDVESIVLHEAGHGLAQGHFGEAFVTLANEKIHFSPRAVMNAGYSGVQQSLTGTDLGGHCSMYGTWPNN